MALEVIMPKAGVDMTEGQIVKWNKKVGDEVKEGEVLLEIMTDKTSMELEAEESGYLLAILKGDGETVPVAEVIGYLGEQGEAIPDGTTKSEVKEEKPVEVKKEEEKAEEVKKEEPAKPKHNKEYDTVVIGGGPAGYVAAIRAAQVGGKVAIVEKDELGGTCLNRGCIPTKAYLHNSEIIEGIHMANSRGILIDSNFKIDMEKVLAMKNTVVKTLVGGVAALLKSNKVDVFKGVAKITKDKDVVVNSEKVLTTNTIIFAGGSKVSKINIPGIDSKLVMTSDDILQLNEVPETLAVIGAGVVGVELGEVFSTYGSKVTFVEMTDRIVPAMDKEVSKALEAKLAKNGMTFYTSTGLKEIKEENGKLRLILDGKPDLVVDRALLSIGRVPDLEGIQGISLQMEKGKIKVDDYMETSIKGIYAPGDVNGVKMLAHAAYRMGEVAAENAILGNHVKANLHATPSAVYTLPEVAAIGLTEEQARQNYDVQIGKFNFAGNGRALASGNNYGFIKVIADKKYGEILGVHIIGPNAAEMINEAAALMSAEVTIEEVIKSIHGHPTYSEAMYEAFADVLGLSVHVMKK
ncbi:dihydrolipoyl dehydrogenase [Oceanivirga miroungae]|uniref:Dihydrolipoyl dehydrogenase n=1 Tax=Oceanivirga miroungae TaxID=1130046 RepID=A0A6I8M6L4_9FUSO|nr:dihydrolipoyl dehydrogenase [Oceanivirga miroungae]VWL85532.1 dihydrolipoamide dehydrogenase [Oceanivirga miroungae]